MSRLISVVCILAFAVTIPSVAGAAEDILLADFEGSSYG